MHARLKIIADTQGGVFSRRQALSAGYTPDQIVAYLRDGHWERIRRGQYAVPADLDHLESWERARWLHRRKIHAAMNSLRAGSVAASHQSALVLHGLPVWGYDLEQVHVSRVDGQSGGLVAGVHHHLGVLGPDDMTTVDGRLATTAGRAVVESACTASFETAVVGVDAVLRSGALSSDEIQRLLELTEFWPGSTTARAALGFGDGLSESVGESRLRVFLYEHGFPAPVLQAVFYDSHGFVARVDFYFPAYRLIIEFDGLVKYGGGGPEVLIQEKRREDRLRARDLTVVRTVWADLNHPARLAATLRPYFTPTRRTA